MWWHAAQLPTSTIVNLFSPSPHFAFFTTPVEAKIFMLKMRQNNG
jgi:hypothetical protein